MNRKKTIYFTLLLMMGLLFTISSCSDDGNICTGQRWYQDADGDGLGNGSLDDDGNFEASIFACDQPEGFVSNSSDLDDTDATINCVGMIFYEDADGDGFGNIEISTELTCDQPDGFVLNSLDTDDTNSLVGNCTGTTWYLDNDSDGLGNITETLISCDQPENYVANADDVDDTDSAINCIGVIFYEDADGDGFGNVLGLREFGCSDDTIAGFVTNSNDSDDSNPLVGENNCTVETWYIDLDGDGLGNPDLPEILACEDPSNASLKYVLNNDDTDDQLTIF